MNLSAVRARCALTISLAFLTLPICAQQPASTPPAALPAYDVISIRPHSALDDNVSIHSQPGIYEGSNVNLKELISYAYGVRDDLVSGLPGWADSAHFDITAKVSDFDPATWKSLTREQREAMFLPILSDRFHVKAHTEIKTLPVFDLVVTKDGPKFKPSPPAANDPDHKREFGTWINNSDLTATSITMSNFAETLAGQVDRTVIDKTGLTGEYDLKLRWTPANTAADDGSTDRPPDLFTALKEQLGLKLEPTKGPVTTLVVDHAEKPTPN